MCFSEGRSCSDVTLKETRLVSLLDSGHAFVILKGPAQTLYRTCSCLWLQYHWRL